MRIAIGYDGSDYSKAAVDDLRRSGLPRAVQALVVSAGDNPVPYPTGGVLADRAMSRRVSAAVVQARAQASHVLEEARRLAEEGKRRTQQLYPDWEVAAEPLLGAAAAALMRRAEEWDADLIVVGSHGRSAIGRFVLGSVSRQVATASSRSVLVSRHVVERGDAPIRIIVGADGSAHAAAAVRVIERREWPKGTEVRVIAVDDTVRPTRTAKLVPTAAAWVGEPNAADLLKLREMMEEMADTLRRAGLIVSAELTEGGAQRLLCEQAAEWSADCIFVGSRGRSSTAEDVRMGSVSTSLVTSAPCSVEVVRSLDQPVGGP